MFAISRIHELPIHDRRHRLLPVITA